MELLFKINIFCGCLEWIKNKLLGMATSIGLNVEAFSFLDLWKMLEEIILAAARQSSFYIFPFEVLLEIGPW